MPDATIERTHAWTYQGRLIVSVTVRWTQEDGVWTADVSFRHPPEMDTEPLKYRRSHERIVLLELLEDLELPNADALRACTFVPPSLWDAP